MPPKVLAALILLVSGTFAAQFPFPQNISYSYGITTSSIDSTTIQSMYREWKINRFQQKDSVARIKWDNSYESVSEGIAYGMLIMVYMDNDSNDTRNLFDKLWKYYTRFSNDNGLMNWHTWAWDSIAGSGAATDADLDAALALCMAYRQWDDSTYLAGARNLIRSIRRFEVDSLHHFKPGDEWNTAKNISYLSFAAMRLFKLFDTDDEYTPDVKTFWQEVIDSSYALALRAQHPKTGLIPDWCGTDGQPKDPENGATNYDQFSYDAVRTPWRMAWAYYWFGDSLAKKFNVRMVEWAIDTMTKTKMPLEQGIGPHNAGQVLKLDGTPCCGYAVHPFCAAWTFCGTVDSLYQGWIDKGDSVWINRASSVLDEYYEGTLVLLHSLLISGNMPNLADGYSFEGTNEIKPSHVKQIPDFSFRYTIENNCFKLQTCGQKPVKSIRFFNLKGRSCVSVDITSDTKPITISLKELNLSDNIYIVQLIGIEMSQTITLPLYR